MALGTIVVRLDWDKFLSGSGEWITNVRLAKTFLSVRGAWSFLDYYHEGDERPWLDNKKRLLKKPLK